MRNFFHTTGRIVLATLSILIAPSLVSSAEIAVTLPPLAGLVAMLDKNTEVLCLLPGNADPHHFQLSPRKIEALKKTHLLIRASFDDGSWPLPPRHAQTLDLWPNIDHGWLSPKAVRQALPRIAQALIQLQPEKTDAITLALQVALKQVQKIEQAWRDALEPVNTAGVMMQHPAWRRLMQEMNIPVLDVLESGHHGHEHGPRQLEHALATLNQNPGAWLIADAGHSNRALDWLQQHADQQPRRISLNALGCCKTSWAEMMRQNLKRMTTAKQP